MIMGKKALKYTIAAIIVLLVAYNSVYFKKLSEVQAAAASKNFDAAAYAAKFWNNKLMPNLHKAVNLGTLLPMVTSNTEQAFGKYSHALGIGNLRYFLIRAKGKVTAKDEEDITLAVDGLQSQNIKIATEYIFGNAVRDGSGMVNINDFTNTMDFNDVSSEINKIIRNKVLPVLKQVKVGDEISFTGAIELNRAHLALSLSQIEAIPVAVEQIH